jgi:hypothetical protein
MLHAFRVPSVQQRVTSSVSPSSRRRPMGLPAIITPTIRSPLFTAIWSFDPTGGRW